jgi:DHA1 family tetracycline resistance protein-like MFS transporter
LRRSPLLFIFITVFIDLLGYGMVVPLLPFFVQRQQAGATAAGALGSVYALMQLISGPVLGALSDRHGRRPVLLLCLLGTAGAYLLLGLSNSLAMIFLAISLDGITGGNLTTVYAYIADVTQPAERARGLGLVGAAFGLGLMAGPALGGLLSVYGLSVPAFIACAIALANVTFGWLVLPESLPPERRTATPSRGAWRVLNSAAQLMGLFELAPIRLLLVTLFTLNLAFSGLQTNFPLYSQARFGWNTTHNGIFFAYVGVCAVFVQGVLFRWIQPRLGEKRLAVGGLALMALALAGVATARQGWMMYPVIGLAALGSGTSIPSLTALVSHRVGAGEQGRLMGGTQALLSLTMIIGPTMAGLSFEHIGVAAPYWLGSLLAASALVMATIALKQPVLTPASE